jgi:hypothetical protein
MRTDFEEAVRSSANDCRTLMQILDHAVEDLEYKGRTTTNWEYPGSLGAVIDRLREAIAVTGYFNEVDAQVEAKLAS